MEKTKEKTKLLAYLLALALLIVPFFWFKSGQIDLGGDSSRLYFYDPVSWLKNIPFYFTNTLNSLGTENPNFMLIPFLVFLSGLKLLLGGNSFLLNCFFSGLLLSGSYFFVFLSINEILPGGEKKLKNFCAILGGLFFALSPLYIYEWQKALYSFNQILVYPLTFFLFLKYLKSGRFLFIYLAELVALVFSINFSYPTFPWFLAFFSCSFLFFFFYSSILKKRDVFIKGVGVFIALFLLAQSFQLLPQLVNLLNFSNPNSRAVFSGELVASRGLTYFNQIQPYIRLIYTLLNQPQFMISLTREMYDFGYRFRFFYYLYPLLIVAAAMTVRNKNKYEKKTFTLLLAIFLALVFFMTANITQGFLWLYRNLFAVPGFSMFRSFYTKFALSYAFFYSLLLGFGAFLLLSVISSKKKFILIVLAAVLIVFNAWPLLSGRIVNSVITKSKGVAIPIQPEENYLAFLSLVKNLSLDGKVVNFPLTYEEYQVFKGQNAGAYFGPSSFAILGGKYDFCGFSTFNVYKNEILEAFKNQEVSLVRRYFSLLNIRYLIYNSDKFLYENFPDYPFQESRAFFPKAELEENFIKKLGYRELSHIGPYILYVNENEYLPHLYIPQTIMKAEESEKVLTAILRQADFSLTTAVVPGQEDFSEKPFVFPETAGKKDELSPPAVEYRRINPVKYRLRIHGAGGIFPLVFLDQYNEGWRIFAKPFSVPAPEKLLNDLEKGNYQNRQEELKDQADREEVKGFVKKALVSELGNDFISHNFSGSIQNDNLPAGNLTETWFGGSGGAVKAKHLRANNYGNLWLIDAAGLCRQGNYCLRRDDGSYDLEIVLEFFPQRYFYLGLCLTILALMIILVLIFRPFMRKIKKE